MGRVGMRRHLLEAFAKKLTKEDVVVVEATGNAASVAAVITPHVNKVVIANPKQVRIIIAHAKIKTDTIDASVLAQLYASGFLPEVWIPDQPTQALRRQMTRRNQIVRQRSRLKNIIQSILHSHLIPSCLPTRRSVRGNRTGMAFSPGLAGGRAFGRRTTSARVRSAGRGPQGHRA
jgi:transposase